MRFNHLIKVRNNEIVKHYQIVYRSHNYDAVFLLQNKKYKLKEKTANTLATISVLSIGVSFINKIFKLPILKSLNRTLGAVAGGVKGFFEIYIISAAVGFLSMLIPDHEITQAITNTVLQNALWENAINFLK